MGAQEYLEELIRYESTSSLTNEPIATHVNQVLQQLKFTTEWVEYVDADGVTKVSVVGKRGTGRATLRSGQL
jgi:acetylornithine deacetylase/succinyl-diaminopimelate desuccinylase-like protein